MKFIEINDITTGWIYINPLCVTSVEKNTDDYGHYVYIVRMSNGDQYTLNLKDYSDIEELLSLIELNSKLFN